LWRFGAVYPVPSIDWGDLVDLFDWIYLIGLKDLVDLIDDPRIARGDS